MAGIWIDIDIDAIAANYREVVKLVKPPARCMAVVKADAYGLGSVEVARTLAAEGCEAFAVTTVEEGLILRRHGIDGIILVLGPALPQEWALALEEDLHLTVADAGVVFQLEQTCRNMSKKVQIHLKLETGMGRTGFGLQELEGLAELLLKSPHLEVAGVYTHFARAAQRDHEFTQRQYERFGAGVAALAGHGIVPGWKHVCNSGAFLDYPEYHHDFVRVGTLLIGHVPGPGFNDRLTLKDPWAAKTNILYVHRVPKGTHVGYQSIYKTKTETNLALIPAGYADGFGVVPHLVPQGGWDLVKIIIKNIASLFGLTLGKERIELQGRSVRVAGKIGMQLTVLDVGQVNCAPGDEVKIPLRRTLANPRLLRQYWRGGRIYAKRTLTEEGVFLVQAE
ncbi:MAG: alanine racemase [Desulfitobacteriaceae bacterium]